MDAKITARRRIWTAIGLGALALSLSACAEVPESRAAGETPRIVSLNPCTDAILVEVADPGQILAISHYSHSPSSTSMDLGKARNFKSLSGNVEEVVALDPDFVLASTFMSPATHAALNDLGYPPESFGIAGDVSASFAQIRQIAEIAGHPERGEALIARIEAALAENRATAEDTQISAVLWQPGEIVPGEQALVSVLMREAGFSSHSAAIGLGQADYLPLENVLAEPPDLLLVAGNSRGQQHPSLAQLEDTSVETLDPSLLYCGGPTIIRAVERLAEIRRGLT